MLLPQTTKVAALKSWIRGTIAALHTELGVQMRAVIAAPVAGLAGVAAARSRCRPSAGQRRTPPGIDLPSDVVGEARTTVLLDEIVDLVGADQRLVDPRIRALQSRDPALAETLRVYLDSFGDVAAAACVLHVHPNTVRYRTRRIERLLATSLSDPDERLLLALGLRVSERER